MTKQEQIEEIKRLASYMCIYLDRKCDGYCDIRCGVYRVAHDEFYKIRRNMTKEICEEIVKLPVGFCGFTANQLVVFRKWLTELCEREYGVEIGK